MMSRQEGNRHIIIMSRGEELIDVLTRWAHEHEVVSASFQGIGAVEDVEIGYYTLSTKSYSFVTFPEVFEVANLTGNVALVDGKPFVHAHAVSSRCDASLGCIGGHVKRARVAVTLEISLTADAAPAQRVVDEMIGLKLISL